METLVAVLSFSVNVLFVAVSRGGIEIPVTVAVFRQFDVVPVVRDPIFYVGGMKEDVA